MAKLIEVRQKDCELHFVVPEDGTYGGQYCVNVNANDIKDMNATVIADSIQNVSVTINVRGKIDTLDRFRLFTFAER